MCVCVCVRGIGVYSTCRGGMRFWKGGGDSVLLCICCSSTRSFSLLFFSLLFEPSMLLQLDQFVCPTKQSQGYLVILHVLRLQLHCDTLLTRLCSAESRLLSSFPVPGRLGHECSAQVSSLVMRQEGESKGEEWRWPVRQGEGRRVKLWCSLVLFINIMLLSVMLLTGSIILIFLAVSVKGAAAGQRTGR